MLARVRSQELTVEEAWEHGLFCEFGTGAVDFPAVLGELGGFGGWAVVEQDRVAVQVDDLPAVRAVEERNLGLRSRTVSGPGPVGADRERPPRDRARACRDADGDRTPVVAEARTGRSRARDRGDERLELGDVRIGEQLAVVLREAPARARASTPPPGRARR